MELALTTNACPVKTTHFRVTLHYKDGELPLPVAPASIRRPSHTVITHIPQ